MHPTITHDDITITEFHRTADGFTFVASIGALTMTGGESGVLNAPSMTELHAKDNILDNLYRGAMFRDIAARTAAFDAGVEDAFGNPTLPTG